MLFLIIVSLLPIIMYIFAFKLKRFTNEKLNPIKVVLVKNELLDGHGRYNSDFE